MVPASPVRSFLFVPGDAPHKMRKALGAGADAIILDLEDAVAPAAKDAARETVAAFLAEARDAGAPQIWVRVNPVRQAGSAKDLQAVVRAGLCGIVVPKIDGPEDIAGLSRDIAALEEKSGLQPGAVRVLAVATETAPSLFRLGDYRAVNGRLYGLTWGAEDLAAALGASTNRLADGSLAHPYQLARTLCLAGARAAGVTPVETAAMDFRDIDAVFRIAAAARQDGFFGMMAIHPAQVEAINRAFTPAAGERDAAARVVRAFADAGNPGVVALDGRMLDLPHLRQAQNILALAELFPAAP